LIAPFLVLLGVGVADLGRGYGVSVQSANAAEVAARSLAASNPGSQATASTVATAAAMGQDSSAWAKSSCVVPATYKGAPNPVRPASGTNGVIQVYVSCSLTLYTPIVSNITGTVTVGSVAVARADW